MLVRVAVPADAEAIAQVHVKAWQEAYRGVLPENWLAGLSVQDGRRRWESQLVTLPTNEAVVVAEDGGSIVGFAFVCPSEDQDASPRTGQLDAIYLEPSVWRRGIGRVLQARALEELANFGFTEATLWVLEENARARQFYERTWWTAERTSRQKMAKAIPFSK
jgi:GNAT superfamily N-acetyltransferase